MNVHQTHKKNSTIFHENHTQIQLHFLIILSSLALQHIFLQSNLSFQLTTPQVSNELKAFQHLL
jgi:hypothetical protein